MNEKFQGLFNAVQKEKQFLTYAGDDLSMGSIPPYGISSGLAQLDLYLGRKGGLPSSKIIEYWGPEWSGKTTAALHAAAEWQKKDGLVIFVDAEQGFSPERFRQIGGRPEDILVHNCLTIEEIFDVILYYVGEVDVETKKKSKPGILAGFKAPVLFIVDSVTSVSVMADAQGSMTKEKRVGMEAQQIKRGLRRINPVLSGHSSRPTVIFITHAVSKIGVMFGKKSDSGGGRGLKFMSTVRVSFTNTGDLKGESKDERKGNHTLIEVTKFRGDLQYKKFTVSLTNEMGFDHYESLKEAMLATSFAKRPASSQVVTILPGTGAYETQVKQTEFRLWVDSQDGGYDSVYTAWKKWCIRANIIHPWGGKNS